MLEVNHELKDIFIQALRYALYRHTYALGQTCDYIKDNLEVILDRRVKSVMLRDIKERLEDDDLSRDEWSTIRILQIAIENWEVEGEQDDIQNG